MDKAPTAELCGCCEPPVALTPALVTNRPGLTAIAYRIGTFAAFREAMLEAIAQAPALSGLTTRQSDDPAITLLDLWAAVADVLTFYQERIANEAFLRTARERDSVLRLARLLDYHLRPGIAAITRLAFTVDDGATVRIPVGLKVMSVPGQDEKPQFFETVEKIVADARLNRVRVFPVPTPFNPFAQGRAAATLVSGPSPLGQGDKLVFFEASRVEEKTVASLTETDMGKQLGWAPPVQASAWHPETTHAAKYTRVLRFFGYNAPKSYQRFVPRDTPPQNYLYDKWETFNAGSAGYPVNFPQEASEYPLDARYEELKPGTKLLVQTGEDPEPVRLVTVTEVLQAPSTFGPLQDTVTHVTVTRVIRSAPAASSWGVNRLDVFARGGEDTCLHLWHDVRWHNWESLGGRITSAPAAVSWGPNRIDVFARGRNQGLWHKWWNGTTWSGWEHLGGILTSGPAVSSWVANRLDVFVRGLDRALWHRSWDGTSWSSWELLGGVLTSAPAAVSRAPNRIDVFSRRADEALWHRWYDGAWHDWQSLDGQLAGAPAVSSWGANRLDVFARGMDDTLVHTSWDGTGWSDWESLGGVLTSDPAAVSWGPNRIDVFARGTDLGLHHKAWNGTSWSGWEALGTGMGQIQDRRRVRIYQLESPELTFRPYGYADKISGGRVTVPLEKLETIEKGRAILLKDDRAGPSLAVVTGTGTLTAGDGDEADHLAIDFEPEIPKALETASAILLGNVVEATHGETVRDEILGDGDAAAAFQRFALRKRPLTYVPSSRSARGESTLRVLINGEKWTEVESLYAQPPTPPVYTARQADDGTTSLQFGDGVTGARLPSGRGNLIATYRQGVGLEGRVKADQLSILLERPVGLKSVTNPAAAEGGADPESLDKARETAPTTVKTFGRAVSLLDFESLATASGEVARAKATWVWRGLEKAVHLTIAGQKGAPFSDEALRRLHSGLTQQRDPNHTLLLANVCRVPVVLVAKLRVDDRYVRDDVKATARQALLEFFAFERMGFAHPIHLSDIYRVLQDVTGVGAVDIDTLHFMGYAGWSLEELATRGATAEPAQGHLRIFAARSRPGAASVVDPVAEACFGAGALPEVLPAEQAFIESEPADITLTATGGLE